LLGHAVGCRRKRSVPRTWRCSRKRSDARNERGEMTQLRVTTAVLRVTQRAAEKGDEIEMEYERKVPGKVNMKSCLRRTCRIQKVLASI